MHAWYIISITPDPTYEELVDAERAQGGTVTYYYVQHGNQQPGPNAGYGTVNSTPNSQFPIAQENGFVRPPNAPTQAGASSDTAPPTYAQAVRGDNKIQKS